MGQPLCLGVDGWKVSLEGLKEDTQSRSQQRERAELLFAPVSINDANKLRKQYITIQEHTWDRQWFVVHRAVHQNFDYSWSTWFGDLF